MLSQPPELSINLWSDLPQATEHLSARIQELAPRTQVELLEAGFGRNALRVSLEAANPDAVAVLKALLEDEIDTLVYSYHWYQA